MHCTGSSDLTNLCSENISKWAHELNQSRLSDLIMIAHNNRCRASEPRWESKAVSATYHSFLPHKPLIFLPSLKTHITASKICIMNSSQYCLKSTITSTGRKQVTDLWPNVTIKSPQACAASLGHLKLMKWHQVPDKMKMKGLRLSYSVKLQCLLTWYW